MSKKLKRVAIPNSVRITPKVTYEVLFSDEISSGPDIMGEMRPVEKQIIIKNGQSNTELVKTFIHELIHALSDENDVGMTETQVRKMETAVYKFLRLNGAL
jgi:hypothetical protein